MKVKCAIIVEVDENKLEELGYKSVNDYLNECCFEMWDADGVDIITEVREYEQIN